MHIDQGTLVDLEIFTPSVAGGQTLFALIDRTRSRLGREALHRRLAAPEASLEQIVQRQQSHRALVPDLATLRRSLDLADLDGVERYLSSRWQVPFARWWPGWSWDRFYLGLRYPSYIAECEGGRARIVAMLRVASELQQRLPASGASLLIEMASELEALLKAAEAARLLELAKAGSGAALLQFDQAARASVKLSLLAIAECLGRLEATWSVAAATVEHGWNYPEVGGRLIINGLRHPFLGDDAVPNDFALAEEVRVCFLTGPNMAGKSTFLKAVAIAFLLGQLGAGVPAQTMQFSPVPALFSSIQIVDNIGAGESFYLAEVRRIRKLALTLRDHGDMLAVVDEPFRGTNVHDASEATLAVITRLAARRTALTLVASHLGELGPLVGEDVRIQSLYFEADVTVEPPRFDFQLRRGVSQQRLGMLFLRQEAVLELLDPDAGAVPPHR